MSVLFGNIASFFTILLWLAVNTLSQDSTADEEAAAAAKCRNAVSKKSGGLFESVYVCEWEMGLEKHLFEIVSDAESQAKYIAKEGERFPVVLIHANITDEEIDENSFNRLSDQQTSRVTQIVLSASNLQSIAKNSFSRFSNLKLLHIKDSRSLSQVNIYDTFCYMDNLLALFVHHTNISCNCELSEAVDAVQKCARGLGSDDLLQIEVNCVNDTGESIPVSNFCEFENLFQSGDDSAVNWAVVKDKKDDEPQLKQTSQATFVLIIIISCVLLAVIIFAVLLFFSHHYCRKNSGKKHANSHGQLPSSHLSPTGKRDPIGERQFQNSPPSAAASNCKQVKFRPLSREYQSIDGCPFDTQIPVSSPVHENKVKNVIPYSTPEQKEADNISNSDDFVC